MCIDSRSAATGKHILLAQQDVDIDAELPDDPLTYDQVTPAPGREEKAGLLSGAQSLSEKTKKAFEAIRNSLQEIAEPDDHDIPVVLNEAVERHIRCFTGPKRDVFARWLVRSEKYAPTIKEILKKNGLPEDLVYLSMIESGFNMKARSRAKASGPWQFMDGTGKQYGLRVDYWIDERYDLEKSTVAAARYLKDLFDRFGCWYLAAASYNAGENRVMKAIKKEDTKDFWKLREYKTLPKETQEYVPQLIAAALIAKEPEKYGFEDMESIQVRSLSKIDVPGGVPLRTIAHALSLEVADLRALNPEILKGITPPDRREYQIKVPGALGPSLASRKLDGVLDDDRRVVDVVRHSVKKRESLARILKRYDVSRSDLRLVNDESLQVRKGHVLYIPRFASLKKSPSLIAANRRSPDEQAVASRASDDDDVVVLKSRDKNRNKHSVRVRLAAHSVKKALKKDTPKAHPKTPSRKMKRTSR
jgi:membrane-bound lytic murein transglycosylase D